MGSEIKFTFIYGKNALETKTFLKNVSGDIECINYIDIYNKLSKNDYYQIEPSNLVVSSYLCKKLNNAIIKNDSNSIYYVLEKLEPIVINRIKDHVFSITDKKIKFHLLVSEEATELIKYINKQEFESIDEFVVY